ncbi:MAG: hypothetical protein JKY66_09175 [Spongiibacteraceae bacterium]|nr:hypothetical protein [Spongiibacteraceae bacterium]
MKKTLNNLFVVLLLAFPLLPEVFADGQFFVLNQENKQVLTFKQLRKIYLGKITIWESGLPIRPCLYKTESATRKFYADIIRKTEEKYNMYWNRQLFSGSGAKPLEFTDRDSLQNHLRRNKGAICVVDGLSQSLKDQYRLLSF